LGELARDYGISRDALIWVYETTHMEVFDLVYLMGIVERVFSVAMMSALPILFFSFQRWPVEKRREDAGVFE
jgi:hypothetical protein